MSSASRVPERGLRAHNWRDRTGERHGRLVVLGWAGYLPYGRKGARLSAWECRCDCGRTCFTTLHLTVSCGCLRHDSGRKARAVIRARSVAKLEKLGRGPLTVGQAARMFHVKQSTLTSRMSRHPDKPHLWIKRPYKPLKRHSKRQIREERDNGD